MAEGDPAALKIFCKTIKNPTMDRYDKDLRETREAIRSLAQDNEAVLEETERSREALINVVGEVNGLKEELAKLQVDLDSRAASLQPAELCKQLRDASLEDEEGSDGVAENFLSGDIPREEFLKKYLEMRTMYHKKKVKLEQLRKMTWRQ